MAQGEGVAEAAHRVGPVWGGLESGSERMDVCCGVLSGARKFRDWCPHTAERVVPQLPRLLPFLSDEEMDHVQ